MKMSRKVDYPANPANHPICLVFLFLWNRTLYDGGLWILHLSTYAIAIDRHHYSNIKDSRPRITSLCRKLMAEHVRLLYI
jgi:hypothetical protein